MNGLILIDKPPDCTSHDIVLRLRQILAEPRIGHFGTLDPLATGLLVLALGKAARFFRFYSKETKVYRACLRLGLATDTYDAQGKPIAAEAFDLPSESRLQEAMAKFTGEIRQIPPPYSAKKVGGKPYYKLARAGGATPKPEIKVRLDRFTLLSYVPPEAEVEVACSSGTYIRSVAHDLGQNLGCGAHLSRLRRLSSGDFRVEQAFTLERIAEIAAKGQIKQALIPLEALLPSWPRLVLSDEHCRLVRTGRAVSPAEQMPDIQSPAESCQPGWPGSFVRLFDSQGRLVALAAVQKEGNFLKPFLVVE
jgi:tRNA pseudouridine55 synthase